MSYMYCKSITDEVTFLNRIIPAGSASLINGGDLCLAALHLYVPSLLIFT